MGLYGLDKGMEGLTLAIWEQDEPVAKGKRREKERHAVGALLREVFGADCRLDHYPSGRPFLYGSDINISISHTVRFVVILAHPHKRVGVDIECLERNFAAVEKKALSREERAYLSCEHRPLQLAIIWSAKEAMYKCLSIDGVDFSSQMSVDKFTPKPQGTLHARFYGAGGENIRMEVNFKTIDNHILVWVVR